MKDRCTCLLLGLVLTAAVFAADTTAQVLPEVDRLVAEKKYLSAFRILDSQEKGDLDPDIALKKVDLAMNYFATSIMHMTFAFKDLEEGEDIQDVRGKPGAFVMFSFDVEKILTPLIEKFPKDPRLHAALADYFVDVYEKYRGKWMKSDADLLKVARAHYEEALNPEVSDGRMYFRAGKAALYMQDLPGAAQKLEIAVKKEADYAPARYNLAYAYLFQNRPADAVHHAVAAYEIYKDIQLKADAAMLAGQAYAETEKNEEALKYFLLCDKIAPAKFENMRRLMRLYAKLGRGQEARAVGERIFELGPHNPTAGRVFLDNYLGSPLENSLPDILKGLAAKYIEDPEAVGNALFHLSVFYLQTGKNTQALGTIEEAEKNFRKSPKQDQSVFTAIEQLRKEAGKPALPK